MVSYEPGSRALNPENHLVNMEVVERALAEANEVEESSDPQVVQDVLEQLQSAYEVLAPLGPGLGIQVETRISALKHEIERLHRILPTHR